MEKPLRALHWNGHQKRFSAVEFASPQELQWKGHLLGVHLRMQPGIYDDPACFDVCFDICENVYTNEWTEVSIFGHKMMLRDPVVLIKRHRKTLDAVDCCDDDIPLLQHPLRASSQNDHSHWVMEEWSAMDDQHVRSSKYSNDGDDDIHDGIVHDGIDDVDPLDDELPFHDDDLPEGDDDEDDDDEDEVDDDDDDDGDENDLLVDDMNLDDGRDNGFMDDDILADM